MRNETPKRESESREEEEVGLRNRGEVEDENNGGGSFAVERDFEREIEREQGRERMQCEEEIRESENAGMRRGEG